MNYLYYGDCLTVMLEWPSHCVDLIYLDPPFNSNRQYNAIYKDETGRPLPDQIEAFCDMWELDEERERAIRTIPVLMRGERNRRCNSSVLAVVDASPSEYSAAPLGLSVLYGGATADNEPDSQTDR